MPDFNTEFIQTLFNPATTELFRSELEAAINALLKTELAAFLGYEKHDSDGWNTGNSRNGYYKRTLATRYGELHLEVPRDRNGDFHSPTLPRYLQHTNALETRLSSFISAASPPVRLQISSSRCMADITRQPLSRISRQPSPSKSKPSIPDRLLLDMPSSSVMPPT